MCVIQQKIDHEVGEVTSNQSMKRMALLAAAGSER